MRIYVNIGATTSVNKRNSKFSKEALESGATQINEGGGIPLLINHDWENIFGWSYEAEVKPFMGEYALFKKSIVPETDDEQEELLKLYAEYISNKKEWATTLLGETFIQNANPTSPFNTLFLPCPTLISSNICKQNCPHLFTSLSNDGLFKLGNNISHGSFVDGDYRIFATPFLRRSFSRWNNFNDDFISVFSTIECAGKYVRLDTDAISAARLQLRPIELDYWSGPIFKGNFTNLSDGETAYGPNDPSLSNTIRTDVSILTQGNEKHLKFEELPKEPTPSIPGKYVTRFLHTVVKIDEEHEAIVHLDGSVRILNEHEHKQRVTKNIKQAGKIGDYKKLWLIEGEVSKDDWSLLVSNYFRGNKDINRFLDPNEK